MTWKTDLAACVAALAGVVLGFVAGILVAEGISQVGKAVSRAQISEAERREMYDAAYQGFGDRFGSIEERFGR